MIKCLKKLMEDQSGSILAPELLIAVAGAVVVSGVVLNSVVNPLKILHEGSAKNITKVSRGF